MNEAGNKTLIKVEFIVIAVLLLIFLVWTARRCDRTRAAYGAGPVIGDTTAVNYLDSVDILAPAANPAPPASAISADTLQAGNVQIIRERVTPLYITIDGMNVRQGPGVNYGLIDRLPLDEEVYFLEEVTDSTERINLGDTIVEAPWVKIRTRKGREGWVYGAGVAYYRKKSE